MLQSIGKWALGLAALGAGMAGTGFALEPAKEQVLNVGNSGEPRELDPGKATGAIESGILWNLFEGLTTLHPISLEVMPGQAESWSVSDDGITYTFKLRPNIKWSDGKPVTANDFVFAWRRVVDPKTASEYAYILNYVKNGKNIIAGKEKDLTKLGVKAIDGKTLQVQLENPTPFFPFLTAFYTYMPVPEHVVKKHPGREWYKAGNIVTNGPFVLQDWELNKVIRLKKSDTYYDKNTVTLQTVNMLPIEKIETEEVMFRTGQLHITNEVPTIKVPRLMKEKAKKEKRGKYHPYNNIPGLGIYYYELNTKAKPLDDVRVRKALSLAIDRKLLVDRVTRSGEMPADAFVPPGAGGYKPVASVGVTSNIEEAKKLLAAAGYPNGKGFPKTEILYNTSENHKKIAVAIQQMWKQNLNVDIGLFNQEWKVYLNTRQSNDFQIARAGWIGDYPDPNTFLDLWTSTSGNNNTQWGLKEYDDLISKANQEPDQAKRFEYFAKAEALLARDMPMIPIYYYTHDKLVSEQIKIFDPSQGKVVPYSNNPQDSYYFKYYRLAKKN